MGSGRSKVQNTPWLSCTRQFHVPRRIRVNSVGRFTQVYLVTSLTAWLALRWNRTLSSRRELETGYRYPQRRPSPHLRSPTFGSSPAGLGAASPALVPVKEPHLRLFRFYFPWFPKWRIAGNSKSMALSPLYFNNYSVFWHHHHLILGTTF